MPSLRYPNWLQVSYTSYNTLVATIDSSNGNITKIGYGSTIISAIFTGDNTYNSKTVSYTLTFKEQQELEYIDDNNLNWSANSFVAVTDEENEFPTLINNLNLPITYESSDPTIASISSNGNLTLHSLGTTNIHATFNGDNQHESKTVSYELKVSENDIFIDIYRRSNEYSNVWDRPANICYDKLENHIYEGTHSIISGSNTLFIRVPNKYNVVDVYINNSQKAHDTIIRNGNDLIYVYGNMYYNTTTIKLKIKFEEANNNIH